MTNRLISEKSPSWIWKPEYEFTKSTLARFAVRQNESAVIPPIPFSETDRSPILCAHLGSNQGPFEYQSNALPTELCAPSPSRSLASATRSALKQARLVAFR